MESTFALGGRAIMEIRMERNKGTALSGMGSALAEIQQRLRSHPEEWLEALENNPAGFADLEKEIHRAFAQMADRVVAGLLAQATKRSEFADAAKKKVTAAASKRKLRGGQPRPLRVRLLGGLMIYI